MYDAPELPSMEIVKYESMEIEKREVLAEVPASTTNASAVFDALAQFIPDAIDIVDKQLKARNADDIVVLKMPNGLSKENLLIDKANDELMLPRTKDGRIANVKFAEVKADGVVKQVANPAFLATAAFQIATIVVGQQQMAEINSRLDKIEKGVSKILSTLEIQHRARIKGIYDRLLHDYSRRSEEYLGNPEKLNAARTELESMITETSALWAEEVLKLQEFHDGIVLEKHEQEDDVREEVDEFAKIDSLAATVFSLHCNACQIRMLFDGDFSEARLHNERMEAKRRIDEYIPLREDAIRLLSKEIKRIGGGIPLAIPEGEGLRELMSKESPNPAIGAAHVVGGLMGRLTSDNPVSAKKKQDKQAQNRLTTRLSKVAKTSECTRTLVEHEHVVGLLDSAYNQPVELAYDGKSIALLKA